MLAITDADCQQLVRCKLGRIMLDVFLLLMLELSSGGVSRTK